MDKKSLWILISVIILLVVAVAGYYFLKDDVQLAATEGNCEQGCINQADQCLENTFNSLVTCLRNAKTEWYNCGGEVNEWVVNYRERMRKYRICDVIFTQQQEVCNNNADNQITSCLQQFNDCLEGCQNSPSIAK